jgi:hypothetical protein
MTYNGPENTPEKTAQKNTKKVFHLLNSTDFLTLKLFNTNRIIKIPKAFFKIKGFPNIKTSAYPQAPEKEEAPFSLLGSCQYIAIPL